MDIYLDVLFLENIVMNYLILFVTAKFSKRKASNLRIFLGALIGAAYVVLVMIFPNMKIYYTVFAKFMLSLLIVAVTFSPEKVVSLIKTLVIFYISTFIFAGAALAFMFLNGGLITNGVIHVFWESKWTLLFLSVVVVGIIIRIFWDILQQKFIREQLVVPLNIIFENRTADLNALIDTGNSLHDPLTNMPVVVVEFDAIKGILPKEISNIFEESKEEDLLSITNIILNSEWFSRFRLIPFTSLGKENGMLIGFKPDCIEIIENEGKKSTKDVIIGVYSRALSKNEKYRALLNPEVLDTEPELV